MNNMNKRERLKQKIESHLRHTARQLVKFDTLEETLNYLMDSFWMEFTCDFVAILLKSDNLLVPKAWKGETRQVETALYFQVPSESKLLQEALWGPNGSIGEGEEEFHMALEAENLSTWFTVPLKEREKTFGLCIIGFRNFVPLILEAETYFVEFGRDVAVAIGLAKEKERQKRKIKGMEWLRENIFPGSSIEQMVEKIVDRAVKGTMAQSACVYLYDDQHFRFTYQPPSFGLETFREHLIMDENSTIMTLFPYLELAGGTELTVPLVVNLKTIGVLHVSGKENGYFTEEDLDLLEFLSLHVSTLIENARLYQNEIESRSRLQRIMYHQQELMKKAIEEESLGQMTKTVNSLFGCSILLLDRFIRPISHCFLHGEEDMLNPILQAVKEHEMKIAALRSKELWLALPGNEEPTLGIWPVTGVGQSLGYFVVISRPELWDSVNRLTINNAISLFANEFIKQKLVLDAKEQVKESFINQLFSHQVEDLNQIVQYASLTHWNIMDPHRVAVLSMTLPEKQGDHLHLIDREETKSKLWDQIKFKISSEYTNIMTSRKGDEFILISPLTNETKGTEPYWKRVFGSLKKITHSVNPSIQIYIGVGGKTNRIEDYNDSYKQAVQTNNLVRHRFVKTGVALFEELESYTMLHQINDMSSIRLFVKKKLSPLLHFDGNGADLFHTLRVYLERNGNIKETSDALFIHRSTLLYRLDKIRDLLQIDLNDSDQRFNLMLAYKLFDLHRFTLPQIR
ncbi:helix-turn-helix domain-containing protein [Paenibacillus naphthalenovorans]|uniref:helix-turn-helix domain-containing protein n=1 Tax=Paenibacillus naphthalenovorans TaxID=162209 RepID=UPI003D2927F3